MIFYRYLFNNIEMLTINEKIVYSSLISYSIRLSEDFYPDGQIDMEYIRLYINSNANATGYGHIPLILPAIKEMSRELDIARNTLKKILNRFKEIRLIENNTIVCHKDLFDSGYITLPTNLDIKGQLLLFYTFLEYRSRSFGGIIDTYVSRLTELTGFSENCIYNMLYKLHKKEFVERLPDGRLKVKSLEE